MGIKKKDITVEKLQSVGAAVKKRLIPYEDFYPINLTTKKKNKSSKWLSFEEQLIEDSPLKSWADLGENARHLYDTPIEALQILVKGSSLFKQTDYKTYLLCDLIEKTKSKKINKDKKLNKLVDGILEQCCSFIGVDYNLVDIPKSKMILGTASNKNKKYGRQQIIDRVVEKHRRLVIQKPKDFKDWQKNNKDPVKKYLTKNRIRAKISK